MIKNNFESHNNSTIIGTNDEYLTPPPIIKALGLFDLDPCSPVTRPWPTATRHFTIIDDGLFLPWEGRVWLNPPYGNTMPMWLNKLALHGNGIALTFARTDTAVFHNYVFAHAHSLFFLKGRISFFDVNGKKSNGAAGSPSVLIAYGKNNVEAIENSNLKGKHLFIK